MSNTAVQNIRLNEAGLPDPDPMDLQGDRIQPSESSANHAGSDVEIRESRDRDVVIYDGQCNFCVGSVRRLRWLDWSDRLRYLSLHDDRVAVRYPRLEKEDLLQQMYVMTPGGDAFGGADAVRYLTRRMPILWPVMPLMHLPFSHHVWHWMYRFVARRRYLLGGKRCEDGVCRL
ncbi:MAG: DUF393 domain-containing protein [Planctomycetota bacterium]